MFTVEENPYVSGSAMSSNASNPTVSVLHDILHWSGDLPDWQRDALRRIVSQEELSDADFEELYSLFCSKSGVSIASRHGVSSQPLAESHLPPAPGDASTVVLVSMGKLQNVNRLPSDQVLSFGTAPGLTIVFGNNGTGKSGYARVVKRACRTRGIPPAIRPNAFDPSPKSTASAEIMFRVSDVDQLCSWKDGVPTDPRLTNVFVFDATTANNYLNEDGPTCFTPYGLDILPKLSKLCDEIRTRLLRDIEALNVEMAVVASNWRYPPESAVGTLVKSLSASTKPSQIESLATLSAKDTARLNELNAALRSDPKQKARETHAAATRLKVFAEKIVAVTKEISPDRCIEMKAIVDNVNLTEAAVKSFATGTFDATFLNGTGTDLWRSLFESARLFSIEQAYREQDFPVISNGARCVLCQQILDSASCERFQTFDRFCRDMSQEHADKAADQLRVVLSRIKLFGTISSELDKVTADLATLSDEQKDAICAFAKRCDEILVSVSAGLTARAWDEPGLLLSSPIQSISDLALSLEDRAKMEESADDPVARAKLQSERDELEARHWLSSVKEDVLAQLARHTQLAALKKSEKETKTRGITDKSIQLTKQIVTDAFCNRFKDEVKALGLRTLSVKMEEIKGKKGETRFGLRLEGTSNHKVFEIASEGEQRCIALAAFLSELSQSSHHSSLVFDDPVTSLDHWHHEKIAQRLAKEAVRRQVIVFTHSTNFLHDLQRAAVETRAEQCIRHLEWSGGIPGKCREGLPWDWDNPKDRFDKLQKLHATLRKSWNPIPNEHNIQEMRHAYSWLRATLERIVEKEVFSDVVMRFHPYVRVQKLEHVVGFSVEECDEIQRLMQRCHDATEAHDAPLLKQSIPEPSDFLEDITSAKAVIELIKQRKQKFSRR